MPWLVTGGDDATVRVWDVESGTELTRLDHTGGKAQAADLDQAVSAGREAVAHDAGEALSRLAFAYWRRHRLRADPADLDQVITLFTRLRERTGPRAAVL